MQRMKVFTIITLTFPHFQVHPAIVLSFSVFATFKLCTILPPSILRYDLERNAPYKRLMSNGYFSMSSGQLIDVFSLTGFADPLTICCGYHVNDSHVWCGTRASIDGRQVYGASCRNPSQYISWDGVHYSQAASQWFANHILNGSLSDPPIPITKSCQRRQSDLERAISVAKRRELLLQSITFKP